MRPERTKAPEGPVGGSPAPSQGGHEAEIARLNALVAAKQAQIDALMLEYCPDEMSPEQLAEWAKHQEPVKFGCHCDIESMPEGFQPDGCVLDEGKDDDCVYAPPLRREGKSKVHCRHWRPIALPKTTRATATPLQGNTHQASVADLAMLVRRLSRFAPPGPAGEATEYLKRHNLQGSPLRG